jgi:hypothetical protein
MFLLTGEAPSNDDQMSYGHMILCVVIVGLLVFAAVKLMRNGTGRPPR